MRLLLLCANAGDAQAKWGGGALQAHSVRVGSRTPSPSAPQRPAGPHLMHNI
ncbi:hypothetical protein K523DRAFT_422442 [Schizophyllum commune Tattone D]|nr:hypothetical protein K523DRAFT_422442 [Schizophyllum commune Tattone D]